MYWWSGIGYTNRVIFIDTCYMLTLWTPINLEIKFISKIRTSNFSRHVSSFFSNLSANSKIINMLIWQKLK